MQTQANKCTKLITHIICGLDNSSKLLNVKEINEYVPNYDYQLRATIAQTPDCHCVIGIRAIVLNVTSAVPVYEGVKNYIVDLFIHSSRIQTNEFFIKLTKSTHKTD